MSIIDHVSQLLKKTPQHTHEEDAKHATPQVPAEPAAPSNEINIGIAAWLRLLVMLSTCLLLLLAIAVGIHLLGMISHTILMFSLGALFAYALDPIVEWVRNAGSGNKHPRWKGVAVVFGLMVLCFVVASVILGSVGAAQVHQLISERELYVEKGRQLLEHADAMLQARGIEFSLADFVDNPPPNVRAFVEGFASHGLTMAAHFSASIAEGAIVILIALYFLLYSEELKEKSNNSLPDNFRTYVEQWQDDVNRILGGFVRGQIIIALITGALCALGCLLLGVPLWLLIGIFVVFAALIPVVGPYIGAVPAIIAAALAPASYISPLLRVVLVFVLFVVVNEAMSKILYPRLVGKALGLHEVVVLFVLLAGYEIGHLWGVLFAAPITALAMVTTVQLYRFWQGLPPAPQTGPANETKIQPQHSNDLT